MIMNNKDLIIIFYPPSFLFNFILLKEIKQPYNLKNLDFFMCYILNFLKRITY